MEIWAARAGDGHDVAVEEEMARILAEAEAQVASLQARVALGAAGAARQRAADGATEDGREHARDTGAGAGGVATYDELKQQLATAQVRLLLSIG